MYLILALVFLGGVLSQKIKDEGSLEDVDVGDIFSLNSTKPLNESKPIQLVENVTNSQPDAVASHKINSTTFKPSILLTDFKPSPQLETYYEYNKKPVVPAYGEAKTLGDYHFGLAARIPQAPWLKVRHYFNEHSSEEKSESREHEHQDTKIRFPTPTPSTLPKIHPYPYVPPMEPISTINPPPGHRKPDLVEEITHKTASGGHISIRDHIGSTSKPIQSEEYYEPSTLNHGLGDISPPFYPHAPGEGYVKPSFSYTFPSNQDQHIYKKPIYETPKHQDGTKTALAISPWKKIIKFLTAIIPFGLLLSALTPTVIDVSPMANYTSTINGVNGFNSGRARLEKNIPKKSLDILNALNNDGCEERVLCELLLNAGSSQNAQQHIETLLDTFVADSKDSVEQRAELARIFKAVKSENCRTLICQQIKEEPQEDVEGD